MIHPFGFQQMEEALRNRVIITAALAAHAAGHHIFSEHFLVITGGILAAPV